MDFDSVLRRVVREEIALALAEQKQPQTESYLSTKEVAALTGLSVAFFEVGRSMSNPEHPPYHRIGRRVVYKKADIDSWIAARKRGGAA